MIMARPKTSKPPSKKTTLDIERYDVIKEYCANRGISIKDYINLLIKEDMMRNGEYFSNRYFKEMAGRV